MCSICSAVGVPACPLVGGCTLQTLDVVKMLAMTGGAGFGMVVTALQTKKETKNEGQK